jgi:hypothetical protein
MIVWLRLEPLMEWRPVPGHEDYEVSSDGQVRRARNQKRNYMIGKILKQKISIHGYAAVSLFSDGKYRCAGVHRLVCEAFHGLPPGPGSQACHNDGNRLNNQVSNLRWGTAKDNADDRAKHGNWSVQRGSVHHEAKLTEDKVVEMRSRWLAGESIASLARGFGVHKVTAREAIHGITWRHV